MRPQPPRPSILRAHFRLHIPPSSALRLSSTTHTPSLLTVRNIPAPHLGHIRILSLNNPRSRNAISRQLLSELRTEIDAIREQVHEEEVRGEVVGEGTRVLVLASEVDEAFCAGADLKERRRMSGDEYVSIISIFLVLEYLWCSSFIYLWVV
jgi:methylglutaconyl-CoA hydratase